MLPDKRQHVDELGIVVKHLFKMRRKPLRIGAVAGKTTTKLVVNTTIDHFIKAQQCLIKRFLLSAEMIVPEQINNGKCLWEFRRGTKTAPFGIGIF